MNDKKCLRCGNMVNDDEPLCHTCRSIIKNVHDFLMPKSLQERRIAKNIKYLEQKGYKVTKRDDEKH